MSDTDQWYIKHHADRPELPLRKQACSDCAVKCGLYSCFSDELKDCKPDTQLFASKRWFCHDTPMCACKGNTENLGITWNAKEIR